MSDFAFMHPLPDDEDQRAQVIGHLLALSDRIASSNHVDVGRSTRTHEIIDPVTLDGARIPMYDPETGITYETPSILRVIYRPEQ